MSSSSGKRGFPFSSPSLHARWTLVFLPLVAAVLETPPTTASSPAAVGKGQATSSREDSVLRREHGNAAPNARTGTSTIRSSVASRGNALLGALKSHIEAKQQGGAPWKFDMSDSLMGHLFFRHADGSMSKAGSGDSERLTQAQYDAKYRQIPTVSMPVGASASPMNSSTQIPRAASLQGSSSQGGSLSEMEVDQPGYYYDYSYDYGYDSTPAPTPAPPPQPELPESLSAFEPDEYEDNSEYFGPFRLDYSTHTIHLTDWNLVVQTKEEIPGRGNVLIGKENFAADASNSFVLGQHNTARGQEVSVLGGVDNVADGRYDLVAGGQENIGRGENVVADGGFRNEAISDFAVEAGGTRNVAQGKFSVVTAGLNNNAGGMMAAVSGGAGNEAGGDYSAVGGGSGNRAAGRYASVPNGKGLIADGESTLQHEAYTESMQNMKEYVDTYR